MRKRLGKNAAFLLAVSLAFTQAASVRVYGAEGFDSEESAQTVTKSDETGEVHMEEETYVNPLYEDVIEESDLNRYSPENTENGIAAYSSADDRDINEKEYTDTVDEAAAVIREGMKQREETIVVYYKTPEEPTKALLREIAGQALTYTGVPDEGDYLQWQYAGWDCDGQGQVLEDMYYMTFTYTYTYYTTYEQESIVDEQVRAVLDELDVYEDSEYEKAEAVYDYVCSTVSYDYDNLNNSDYKLKYTAYAALIDHKAVCQGYALLYYRMALELGLNSRIISGTGNGDAHGWNIVCIDGLYYDLDPTWDAGSEEYSYFLKCEADFSGHIRDEEYTTDDFNTAYPMSPVSYVPGKTDEENPGTGDNPGDEENPDTGDDSGTDAEPDDFTGLRKMEDGIWYYFVNGVVQDDYTGLVKYTTGSWYYVENGMINYSTTGLIRHVSGSWYYVVNGKMQGNYTGLVKHTTGSWYYVENGKINYNANGLVKHVSGTWYYVLGGRMQSGYTGLVKHTTGSWYYVEKGKMQGNYTGLARHTSGTWYYVVKGRWDSSYNGIVNYNGKSYNVRQGRKV